MRISDWSSDVCSSDLASLDIGTGSLYGGLRIVGEATRGNGDAAADSTTSDQPSATALDNYFLGWKSGDSLSALGDDGLDLPVGRQAFTNGDGFLIQDGNTEGPNNGRASGRERGCRYGEKWGG